MKTKKITIDPAGFVVFWFESWADRAEFIRDYLPPGNPFSTMRTGGTDKTKDIRLSWVLTDLKSPFDLVEGANAKPQPRSGFGMEQRPAVSERDAALDDAAKIVGERAAYWKNQGDFATGVSIMSIKDEILELKKAK
jgi:hypothetical protein